MRDLRESCDSVYAAEIPAGPAPKDCQDILIAHFRGEGAEGRRLDRHKENI